MKKLRSFLGIQARYYFHAALYEPICNSKIVVLLIEENVIYRSYYHQLLLGNKDFLEGNTCVGSEKIVLDAGSNIKIF